ncbi:MAG: ankyrin repeat domain-containing protein, partial [Patescibacteria group bacterium]|nr:ankyrin repeat domain-containing protein [Patescibacteria group bacterium]
FAAFHLATTGRTDGCAGGRYGILASGRITDTAPVTRNGRLGTHTKSQLMGAFLVNFHARATSRDQVAEALRHVPAVDGWVAVSKRGWVAFWDRQSSDQNIDRIRSIGEDISRLLQTATIAFLVHDSDVFCYWLYDCGEQLDKYYCCPGYWGEDAIDRKPLFGNCEVLAKYCRAGTHPRQLEKLLAPIAPQGLAAAVVPAFRFAEDRLLQLATMLGLDEDQVMTDCGDIGREVHPAELGAIRIGAGEQLEQDTNVAEQPSRNPCWEMPPAPLHEAAAGNDIAAIERLITSGADINEIPHGYTCTALALASSQGEPATIRKLVSLGADLQKKGRDGATPLRFAVQSSQIENIRTLVELGADIHEYDPKIGTLLHVATVQCSARVVRVLLDLGLDPRGEHSQGITPLRGVMLQLQRLRQAHSGQESAVLPAIADRIRELEELERIMTN